MPDPDGGWFAWTGVFALSYLLGSIPFGLILTRLAGLGDIRAIGSGNIGATNVLRTGHKGLAAATLVLDGLKGTLAVWLGWRWGLPGALAAGLGAFVGHCFPVWLKFKGGKGVATFLGILLGLHWPTMVAAALVWIATAFISRYSSLSALLASAAAPLILWANGRAQEALLALGLTAVVWIKHHANIRRLLDGTEGRIGKKAAAAPES